MAKETTARPDQALRETEAAAYHAFREWPLLLVMRQKELGAMQAPAPAAGSIATALPKEEEKEKP